MQRSRGGRHFREVREAICTVLGREPTNPRAVSFIAEESTLDAQISQTSRANSSQINNDCELHKSQQAVLKILKREKKQTRRNGADAWVWKAAFIFGVSVVLLALGRKMKK